MDLFNVSISMATHFIEVIALPLLLWTVIALSLVIVLNKIESRTSPVFQYHIRMALFWALPAGIFASHLMGYVDRLLLSPDSATRFIAFNNPLVVLEQPEARTSFENLFSSPVFWIEIACIIAVIGSIFFLYKMISSRIQLWHLVKRLDFHPLYEVAEKLPTDIQATPSNSYVAFSPKINMPFTYGWLNPKIILPADIQKHPLKVAMAIQHEVIHIKRRDYVVNLLMMGVKLLFWFHPLIQYLYKTNQEYREITCDNAVLRSAKFSSKQYASFLFELATRTHQDHSIVISMAKKSSTLKKRLKAMTTQTKTSRTIRSGIIPALILAGLIVGTMACSDISDNGITKSEIENVQSQMTSQPGQDGPIYVINDEVWEGSMDQLSRLKTKYIESVHVLKQEKATEKYGKIGSKGVIEMQILNPRKAFSDLHETPPADQIDPESDYFIEVDEMPELKGGLASLVEKMRYPKEAKEAGEQGRVILQFIIDEQGEVENPQIVKGVSESLNKEALRVVKQAEFKPGKHQGKNVRVQYALPIVFKLPSE